MRPAIRFLSDELIEQILSEARDLLRNLGAEIHNQGVLALLSAHGAVVDGKSMRARFPDLLVDAALETAPHSFHLYDVLGRQTHDFSRDMVHFTPGSTAINLLDADTERMRLPTTTDYVRYAKLIGQLDHLASQSTAMIPADVPGAIADSYRLFLSLMYCEKPVVTGAFRAESFDVMRDLQVAVRGSAEALSQKPLTIFSCCPTSPLKWSYETSQNVVDCAHSGIPVEFIAMPLSGFMAPVTLVGSVVQHTAETLSGIVISQLSNPGAPMLYGGSPAIFDIRHETTPMGAIETMMMDCAYSEVGKHLGLPTQAYISLSDAKLLDAQAGLESGMGATLAALAGINSVSGPGMLDFESCLSLEKLVLDNEICGMALRLTRGMSPKEDFPSLPLFQELLLERQLLISDHTLRYHREEHTMPGPVIDRANRERWKMDGEATLLQRATREVDRLVEEYEPSGLGDDARRQLVQRMEAEAERHGMGELPARS
jgi:trimethylamine---corrinoid protein Co-methyltransferase